MYACRIRAGKKVSGHWTLCPRYLWWFKFINSSPTQLPTVILGMGSSSIVESPRQGKGLLNEMLFSRGWWWLHPVVLQKFASSEEASGSVPTWFLCVLWKAVGSYPLSSGGQARAVAVAYFVLQGLTHNSRGGYPTPDAEGIICQAMHLGRTLFPVWG